MAAGDKDVVTRALGTSRLWATIGGGIVNEVFWPTTGIPQLRDLGFLVTGTGWWAEVKRTADYTVSLPAPGVPAPTIVHHDPRFTLVLDVACDPERDVLIVHYTLDPADGQQDPALALHVLAAPRLGGSGHGNSAHVEGRELFAVHEDAVVCLACDPPLARASVGFVGFSDLWQDLDQHGEPTWEFDTATGGNVALSGTCDGRSGTLALAFAESPEAARTLARSSLARGHEAIDAEFESAWSAWTCHAPPIAPGHEFAELATTSAMVLRVHEDVTFPGAIVASLATPWGAAHDDPGGYHLVWPRDCVNTALALAAVGFVDDAYRTAEFLSATQLDDGHWPQNFTPGGEAYWTGHQLDETALPIVLAAKLAERGSDAAWDPSQRAMVRRAATYLAANGPVTDQDRWEESAGLSPYSIAASIAALAGAALAGFLDPQDAAYALSLADWWNARIESMVYVTGTALDARYGTAGHYERIAAPGPGGRHGRFVLANRGGEMAERESLVGLEFLALVRFGLRSPTDPRIADTVRVIDGELRVELPGGPLYYRYQHDGYGEHADGSPFDGTGIGRLWPLLAAERGQYAVSAGEDPLPYLRSIAATVSPGGLIPEQVWDADDIPSRRLRRGQPSGSAMPLVWAHAEFLKLLVAATRGDHADRLESVTARYRMAPPARTAHIRGERWIATDAPLLLIERDRPFVLHAGLNGWGDVRDLPSEPLGLGRHGVVLDRHALGLTSLAWTTFDPVTGAWEGVDHVVECRAAELTDP